MAQDTNTKSHDNSGDVTLTKADLSAMIAQAVASAVKAMKEPTEAEKAETVKKASEAKVLRERSVLITQREQAARVKLQNACKHTKNNNRSDDTAIVGQVHTNGKIRPFCSICFKQFPIIVANSHHITNGVQF